MKTAIMQPYLFPYIGYFQLMTAVDNFVFYDTANYIKGGWINRNRILGQDGWQYWGLKVHGSSNLRIMDVETVSDNGTKIKKLRTLEQVYSKAPYKDNVLDIVYYSIFYSRSISDIAIKACMNVLDYLGIECPGVTRSSAFGLPKGRNKKIIYMCDIFNTTTYINTIGGKDLYTQRDFHFDLRFLRTGNIVYSQKRSEFIPNLSIIDVLMFNSPERVKEFLTNYTLES